MCYAWVWTAASMVVSAIGSYKQGEQQKEYAEYQAAQADADAKAERDAAEIHAEKIRKLAKNQAGEARAAFAGSGVDVGEGTPVSIDSAIHRNAEDDAWSTILGGRAKGAQIEAQGRGLRISGQNATMAGNFGAASSALGAAGQIAKGWKKSAGSESKSAGSES